MDSSDDRQIETESRDDISALASTVISVISDQPGKTGRSIRSSVIRKLVKATLREGTFNAEAVLRDLEDGRVTADQVVDIYIPEAARELGAMWVDDAIGFARVTIATARLQGLLTLMAPPWSAQPGDDGRNQEVLFILQEGDTHTLGPHVATAQLRRLGASVRLLFGPDPDTLMHVLANDRYDLVMFSCSRVDRLETIAQMIKRMRTGLVGTPPTALGGLVLSLADRVKEKTGVDLVTSDVRVALRLCDNKRQNHRTVAGR